MEPEANDGVLPPLDEATVQLEAAETEPKDFERLERTVQTIATRRDPPGKQELVWAAYLNVIEARWREGRLSLVQWVWLVAVLLAGRPGPQPSASA